MWRCSPRTVAFQYSEGERTHRHVQADGDGEIPKRVGRVVEKEKTERDRHAHKKTPHTYKRRGRGRDRGRRRQVDRDMQKDRQRDRQRDTDRKLDRDTDTQRQDPLM